MRTLVIIFIYLILASVSACNAIFCFNDGMFITLFYIFQSMGWFGLFIAKLSKEID